MSKQADSETKVALCAFDAYRNPGYCGLVYYCDRGYAILYTREFLPKGEDWFYTSGKTLFYAAQSLEKNRVKVYRKGICLSV